MKNFLFHIIWKTVYFNVYLNVKCWVHIRNIINNFACSANNFRTIHITYNTHSLYMNEKKTESYIQISVWINVPSSKHSFSFPPFYLGPVGSWFPCHFYYFYIFLDLFFIMPCIAKSWSIYFIFVSIKVIKLHNQWNVSGRYHY